jgi:hypothetical protein
MVRKYPDTLEGSERVAIGYVSFDDGADWQSLQLNLPHSPVYDTAVHGDDLVVATHGRAFWVLDNITPLRQISAQIASQPAHLFTPAVAYRERGPGGFGGGGARRNAGQNPPAGAIIDYYLGSASSGVITLLARRLHGQKHKPARLRRRILLR